ncbi:hypothetical protein [Desulfovibrio sp. ZJ369]|uniref:hypothetical protein n=1 Tax=Desulfovibrio sp. ZJ369 TaxID=2709793 RepID=UPI0013EA88FD|nr:hypothetical protein [Desulfovibrio sp. ZJ369]
MEAIQLARFAETAAEQTAACRHILLNDALPLWLFPLLLLSGALLQLAFLRLRRRRLLLLGALLVLGAAAVDRDLTLAVGQIFVAAGLLRLFDANGA